MCENFSISLNREPPIYYVGEELKGHLCLKLESKTKVNLIKANILGIEQYYEVISEQTQTQNNLLENLTVICVEFEYTSNYKNGIKHSYLQKFTLSNSLK